MIYERTDEFIRNYADLSNERRALLRAVIKPINAAFAEHGMATQNWPRSLDVRAVHGTTGIYRVTVKKGAPVVRATFEFVVVHEQNAIRWRRCGDHSIYKRP